jgi:hypothetical protein
MANPLKIAHEIALHLDGHPVFQKIVSLGQKLWREISKALLSKLAIGGAAKIHLRIYELVPAVLAFPSGLVLEEFHTVATIGAFSLKNGPSLPVAGILSWAFHGSPQTNPSKSPYFIDIMVFYHRSVVAFTWNDGRLEDWEAKSKKTSFAAHYSNIPKFHLEPGNYIKSISNWRTVCFDFCQEREKPGLPPFLTRYVLQALEFVTFF